MFNLFSIVSKIMKHFNFRNGKLKHEGKTMAEKFENVRFVFIAKLRIFFRL